MGLFRRFTQDAIDRGDRDLVIRCFQLADWVFANADHVVKNAVSVSYLEDLEFHGSGREWANAPNDRASDCMERDHQVSRRTRR